MGTSPAVLPHEGKRWLLDRSTICYVAQGVWFAWRTPESSIGESPHDNGPGRRGFLRRRVHGDVPKRYTEGVWWQDEPRPDPIFGGIQPIRTLQVFFSLGKWVTGTQEGPTEVCGHRSFVAAQRCAFIYMATGMLCCDHARDKWNPSPHTGELFCACGRPVAVVLDRSSSGE